MTQPSPDNRPTVCVLTPAGRGAIAVVSVVGAGSAEVVDARFEAVSRRSIATTPTGRIAFGRWGLGDSAGEEVVVTRFEDRIEVHCHGGVAASGAVVRSLVAAGCREIDQKTWLNNCSDCAIAIEAQKLLAHIVTEKAAMVLVDQMNGALRLEIERVAQWIDAGDIAEASDSLQSLSDRWSTGLRLTRPARVVLTGPPNVGKSSLVNALVGYERAIVFDTPGTTRDLVTATTAIDGWAVELVDTAGLRRAASGVEQAGIELARTAIAEADLVVRVREARAHLAGELPTTEFDQWIKGQRVVEVANKVDLLSGDELKELEQQGALVLTVATARQGIDSQGIEQLLTTIAAVVVPPALPAGTAVPFTQQQHAALAQATELLATGDAQQAKQTLLALLVKS